MTNNALAIIPKTLGEVESLAEKFAKSTLIPDALRNKPADVLVSIMAGSELGLTPMAAIRGVSVIQGKPVLNADTMVALVLGSGLAEFFRPKGQATDTSATYETKRKGESDVQTCTWTIEDAKRAELTGKDNWKKNPRAMLKARAKSMLARDVYPDVLAGCFTEDEAREFSQPRYETAVIDAEIVERPAPQAEDLDVVADLLIADVATAGTVADLDSLAPRFGKLPKGTPQRKRASDAFTASRAELVKKEEAKADEAAA